MVGRLAGAGEPAVAAEDLDTADAGNSNRDDGASPATQGPVNFDEVAYLAAFPDVVEAIRDGHATSAFDHYQLHGRRENRLDEERYRQALAHGSTVNFPEAAFYLGIFRRSGRCLVSGWIGDSDQSPLGNIE